MNSMGTSDYNFEKLMENSEITLFDALEIQGSPVDNTWYTMYIYIYKFIRNKKYESLTSAPKILGWEI